MGGNWQTKNRRFLVFPIFLLYFLFFKAQLPISKSHFPILQFRMSQSPFLKVCSGKVEADSEKVCYESCVQRFRGLILAIGNYKKDAHSGLGLFGSVMRPLLCPSRSILCFGESFFKTMQNSKNTAELNMHLIIFAFRFFWIPGSCW